MKAVVRSVSSPDVDVDTYRSPTPEDDGLLLTLYVGADSGSGEESFDVIACTPSWFSKRVLLAGPALGLHHLFVSSLDLEIVTRFLTEKICSLEAPTWGQLAEKLARIGRWEFEDYQPYEG